MAVRTILIVDDEDDIREVTRVSLELVGGWTVVAAGSGKDALAEAKAAQPDAILLDVMMPDMDGPTTFLALQADAATRHIPVILLTAKVQAADRLRFSEMGVSGVLAKPFDPMTLPSQVAEVLSWSS